MAKRKPAKRKPVRRKPIEIVKFGPAPKPVKRWTTWHELGLVLAASTIMVSFAVWSMFTPRGVTPPKPEPTFPVVTLEDTPAEAVSKSDARYLLNKADALEEFAELAPTFGDSAAAAAWFKERTAKARADAYAGEGGFDAYVFGHAGGTENGEDRYDAKTLAAGALEMAAASRKSAALILENGQR